MSPMAREFCDAGNMLLVSGIVLVCGSDQFTW